MVGPVESGDSKVRDHFFLLSSTLPVGVLGPSFPSGFERVCSLLKARIS